MPRNFSELKSGGGTIPMLSPHPNKWGDAPPPVPHRSTPVSISMHHIPCTSVRRGVTDSMITQVDAGFTWLTLWFRQQHLVTVEV